MDPQAATSPLPTASEPQAPDNKKLSDTLIAGEWPGGFKIVKRSIVDLFTNLVPYLVGFLAFIPLGIAFGLITTASAIDANHASLNVAALAVGAVGVLALIFVGICSVAATPLYGLARADRRKMTTKEFYHLRFGMFLKIVGASIILAIPIFLGFVLLIIPGLFALYYLLPTLALTPFIIVENNARPMAAIKSAHKMVKAHKGKVFGIMGWYLLLFLILLIPLIIITVLILSRQTTNAGLTTGGTAAGNSNQGNGGSGGGGFGGSALSTISFAYLYRWLQHQKPEKPTEPPATAGNPTAPSPIS